MGWIWFREKDYGSLVPLLCLESLRPAQLAAYLGLGSTSKHIKGEPETYHTQRNHITQLSGDTWFSISTRLCSSIYSLRCEAGLANR